MLIHLDRIKTLEVTTHTRQLSNRSGTYTHNLNQLDKYHQQLSNYQ